jgi:hypothetical protein
METKLFNAHPASSRWGTDCAHIATLHIHNTEKAGVGFLAVSFAEDVARELRMPESVELTFEPSVPASVGVVRKYTPARAFPTGEIVLPRLGDPERELMPPKIPGAVVCGGTVTIDVERLTSTYRIVRMTAHEVLLLVYGVLRPPRKQGSS